MDGVPEHFPIAAGTRLLLVDDNPKLCRMVKEYLDPLGYDVSVSHTGTDGLEKALHGEFHAIILDVMLPGLDGFEVLRRLRAKSTVPVIMLTDAARRPTGSPAWNSVPTTTFPRPSHPANSWRDSARSSGGRC